MVLVRVHADSQLAGIDGCLIDANSRAAGGSKDNVRPTVELAAGKLAALRRIVPSRRRVSRHVNEDLGIGVHLLGALLIAAGKLPYKRNVHAADEADFAALGRHRRQHADEVGAFMLLEDNGLNIRGLDHAVDQRELHIGQFGGPFAGSEKRVGQGHL